MATVTLYKYKLTVKKTVEDVGVVEIEATDQQTAEAQAVAMVTTNQFPWIPEKGREGVISVESVEQEWTPRRVFEI